MKKSLLFVSVFMMLTLIGFSQSKFNGLEMNMGNLYRLSDAKTRSISPENITGEKGKGGMANPADKDKPNMANATNAARDLGQGWKVNPGSAFNCYWTMPFRKKCRITMENINDSDPMNLYYQIDYTLTEVPSDAGYFHAQFRRSNPSEGSIHTVIDGIKGKGQYVGVYMAWGVHNNGWWGEGEIKFFMDGDSQYPTICGTGTEDYFCGSYDFDTNKKNEAGVMETNYTEFCTPYAGLPQVIKGDGHYAVMQRFGLYRWHIVDPVRFDKDLKITIQDLGWHKGGRYLKQQSDIASTTFWYQTEPHAGFPKLPVWQALEVN